METPMTWSQDRNDDFLRSELSRCLDACRACELYCTMGVDVARTVDDTEYSGRGATVLRTCAMICAATASSIGRLRVPDVDAVAEALLACRVACRAARSECRRRSFDACCGDCAAACDACASLCESLLSRTELAAA